MAKKIGAIASLSIIGILIIVTIVLANVKIDYSVNCANPTTVYVSYSNNGGSKVSNEQANKIVDIINNSSKENTLSALFNGNLNKKAELKKATNNQKISSTSGFYVEYSYENAQKLMDGKEEYKNNDNTVLYQRLVFTVNSANETTETKVYVFTDLKSEYYSYYYTVEANFYDLYNYLVENNLNN